MKESNKPENRELSRYGDTDITEYVEPQEYPVQENTISLLDLVGVLAKRWKLIFFSTVFAAIGIVLFALYTSRIPQGESNPMPNTYKPEVEVLIQQSSSAGGLSSMLNGGDLGALGALVGIESGGGTSNAALAQKLLVGNTILDQIVDEFNIIEKYNLEVNPKHAARGMIRNGFESEFNASTGILTVSYSSTDPEFATDLLNSTVSILENRFNELTEQKLEERKQALAEKLARSKNEMEQAQEELLEFQKRTGIVDPTVQQSKLIESIATFTTDLYQKQLELELLKEQYPAESTQVTRKKMEIQNLEKLLDELETGFQTYSPRIIPQNEMGELAVEFIRLRSNLELQSELYSTLKVQIETAELEGTGGTNKFQIIESAEVPVVKAGPSRGKLCIIVTLIVFFLSVFLSFIFEYFDRVKQDPEEAKKLEYIKKSIGFRQHTR